MTFSSQLVLRADGVARDGLGLVRDRFSRGREWGLVHSIGARVPDLIWPGCGRAVVILSVDRINLTYAVATIRLDA